MKTQRPHPAIPSSIIRTSGSKYIPCVILPRWSNGRFKLGSDFFEIYFGSRPDPGRRGARSSGAWRSTSSTYDRVARSMPTSFTFGEVPAVVEDAVEDLGGGELVP